MFVTGERPVPETAIRRPGSGLVGGYFARDENQLFGYGETRRGH
jgi:hypothetical protein